MKIEKTKKKSDNVEWLRNTWRPIMGWQYMLTCTFDFIIFPIGFSILQTMFNGIVSQQWHPITLEGAGLYHISMGAILGVSAWTRGQEKLQISRNQRAVAAASESTEEEP